MNYEEALNYIHGTYKFGWKSGLDNIRYLLNLMGNPQDSLKFVHVAGTNGKGSTVAYISSILMASGYKTGIYISPYIERFTERIKINSEEIPGEELARLTGFVKDKVDVMLKEGKNHPTEFEIITALAFQYYYEKNCDIVVLEVGLGGRFDATNIIDTPLLSVITTISLDHIQWLGDTLEKIAFEKAGIIKENGDVLLYPQPENIAKLFEDVCAERKARLYRVDLSGVKPLDYNEYGQVFDYGNYRGLKISLLGDHQIKNAVTALKTSELLRGKGFIITEDTIKNGLLNTRWPGRLEILRRRPLFIIDGTHNPEGANVLKSALDKYFPGRRRLFIFGVLRDKDYNAIIREMLPCAHSVITVASEDKRAIPAVELADIVRPYCKSVSFSDKIKDAIVKCLDESREDDLICAFGSFSFIGEVRQILFK